MSYKPSDSVTVEFITSNPATSAAANADSTPTGTFARNGTDDGTVTVTVTNVDTGRYKAAFTIPSGASAGDTVTLSIAATVNSVAGKGIVWQAVIDRVRVTDIVNSSNRVDLGLWLGSAPDALSSGKIPADLKLWLATAPLALSSQLVQSIVADYASGKVPLQPTVAGRTLDVAATGEAGLDFDNIHDASGAHNLANITVPTVTTVTNPVTAGTVSDKTGYALTSAYDPAKTAAQAGDAMALTSGERTTLAGVIWNTLTSALTTVGSIGKLLVDNINAALSTIKSQTDKIGTTGGDSTNVTGIKTQTDKFLFDGSNFVKSDPQTTVTVGNVTLAASQPNYAPAKAGDAMALTSGERTTLAGVIDTELSGVHGGGGWGPGGGGTGAFTVTVHVTDGTSPLQNARVRLTEGVDIFSGITDASGNVEFSLNAATYTIGITKDGYSFTPSTIVVTTTATFNEAMTAIVIPGATDPGQSNCYVYTYDIHGVIETGVNIEIVLVRLPTGVSGHAIADSEITITSDITGLASVDLIRGATYQARRGTGSIARFTVADNSTFEMPSVLGHP